MNNSMNDLMNLISVLCGFHYANLHYKSRALY